jgi:hypothetical protein
MKSLTDKEYLELLSKLVDQQYDDAVDDYDIDKMEWFPAESEAKQKMVRQVNSKGMIDLTHVKSSLIKEEIHKCGNIKVGIFKIVIRRYSEVPSQKGVQLCCDLKILIHQSQTMNGFPCNMDNDIDLTKDSRFKERPWLKYFRFNYADNVPIDTVVEIVRWLQALKKLSAFL